MPKNRRRNNQKGAKSISIRTKFKIGGRKGNRGAEQMSNIELQEKLLLVRKKDRNKLRQILHNRGLINDDLTGGQNNVINQECELA